MFPRRGFVVALWVAFVLQGAFYALIAPMWEGFDEPGHLAYILFIDDHGRPPGFDEPSFPKFFVDANADLPSVVGHGAPTFAQWRAMTRAQRDFDRARADQLAKNPDRYRVYISNNYERQQGPLFYYLAAIPAFFLRHLTLPKLLVAMRIFCVLLASTAVPIAARLFEVIGDRALLVCLPLFALAPNTLFTFDRVSNEALAFPLATAIALELVIVVVRPSRGHYLALGLLTAAGIFTRLTFLAMLPGIAIALLVTRRKNVEVLAIPAVAMAILLIWNKIGSGHLSGIVEQSYAGRTSGADIRAAFHLLRSIPLTSEFVRNHLWVGGWGFIKPPAIVYDIALVLIAIGIVAIALKWRGGNMQLIAPLIAVLLAFLAALAAHLFAAAIGAVKTPGTVTVGPGGWYVDEIRAIELGIAAFFIAGATTPRSAVMIGRVLIVLCAIAVAAGVIFLLLPHWAGGGGDVYRAAIDAAPVRRSLALPIIVAIGWIAALLAALYLIDKPRAVRV